MKTEVARMNKTIAATLVEVTGMRYVPHLTVNPGDTVAINAGANTVSIWFPEPGVFATTEIVSMQTGEIEIPIPSDAALGTYEYSIYMHNLPKPAPGESRYTTSDSHPLLIIEDPDE